MGWMCACFERDSGGLSHATVPKGMTTVSLPGLAEPGRFWPSAACPGLMAPWTHRPTCGVALAAAAVYLDGGPTGLLGEGDPAAPRRRAAPRDPVSTPRTATRDDLRLARPLASVSVPRGL